MKSYVKCELSILSGKIQHFPEKINRAIIDFENQIKTFASIYENIFFSRNRLISKDSLKKPLWIHTLPTILEKL